MDERVFNHRECVAVRGFESGPIFTVEDPMPKSTKIHIGCGDSITAIADKNMIVSCTVGERFEDTLTFCPECACTTAHRANAWVYICPMCFGHSRVVTDTCAVVDCCIPGTVTATVKTVQAKCNTCSKLNGPVINRDVIECLGKDLHAAKTISSMIQI